MKKIFKIMTAVLVLTLVLTGCTTDDSNTGDIDFIGDVGITDDGIKMEDGLEVQEAEILTPIEESFYLSQFSPEDKEIVNQIKDSVRNLDKEVVLSRDILERDFLRMMNILWLDEPEFFYLSKKVDFETEGDGYVRKISLYYDVDSLSDIDTIMTVIERGASKRLETEMKPYDVFLYTMNNLKLDLNYCDINTHSDIIRGNAASTMASIGQQQSSQRCYNPQGIANIVSYALKQNGIEAMNVYGEYTSSVYDGVGISLPEPDTDYDAIAKLSGDKDGVRTYKLETDKLYAWNMVRMNNHYYHVDEFSNIVSKEKTYKGMAGGESYTGAYMLTDVMTSLSRVSYVSEELLGVRPMADNYNFNPQFRSGNFIKKSNSRQLTNKMLATLEHEVENKMSFDIQFESPENYNYFVDNIDQFIEMHNSKSKVKIVNERVIPMSDVLFVKFINGMSIGGK